MAVIKRIREIILYYLSFNTMVSISFMKGFQAAINCLEADDHLYAADHLKKVLERLKQDSEKP